MQMLACEMDLIILMHLQCKYTYSYNIASSYVNIINIVCVHTIATLLKGLRK